MAAAILKDMKFKNDAYRNSRGGSARLLDVSCRKCQRHICYYQKDGPGHLRRMYIDRIIEPMVDTEGELLVCDCSEVLGLKIAYQKENRSAMRLFVDAVVKKIIPLKSLAK